ncbi:MAG: dihydroorotase [Candidatus Amulumruptor caecigallinarius]|nr:dihydroorotase [Candidatus Amulumruptor caecigallinarius]
MDILIKNGEIWAGNGFAHGDVFISHGVVREIGENITCNSGAMVINANGGSVIPGLVDVHVHLREPGFAYKESIACGTAAAAAGGFTTVCTMPNLKPAPDTVGHLRAQLDIIETDAKVEVLPYATITRKRMGNEPADYFSLAPYVAGFSDDGSDVQSGAVMASAMAGIEKTGKILAAHCEHEELVAGGYIHKGIYAETHNHRGICSESEWRMVERNIEIARETGCRLHLCHISTRESIDLIRKAKSEGIDVTCETGAHYLAFCDTDLQEDGRFKMNPPLRSKGDRDALLRGIADGTIDMIASDHAPHSHDEKSCGLERSAMGVTGLEVSLSAVYTYAVKPGIISMQRMIELMADAPRRRFGIKGGLAVGQRADIAIVDFNESFRVDATTFLSKGKATPFDGLELQARVKATIAAGKPVYNNL